MTDSLITFERKTTIKIVGSWPETTLIDVEMLTNGNSPHVTVTELGHILIKVDNGWAKYMLDKQQDGRGALRIKRMEWSLE